MAVIAVPPGIVCIAEQYSRMLSGDVSIHCLTRGESIGLTIVAEIGLLSLFAVCCVSFIIITNVVRHVRHAAREGETSVLQEPMDKYPYGT
ncbi:hypothetical protein FPV67DRAFT_1002492 [Lyophyllum atratum]|nr:hypothetical protein FPV67DRAFT_1002492 [Lyophyllum atratum]